MSFLLAFLLLLSLPATAVADSDESGTPAEISFADPNEETIIDENEEEIEENALISGGLSQEAEENHLADEDPDHEEAEEQLSIGTVYVDGSASISGDGQSDSNPVKSLSEAYNILGENGGTIVVCGDITINETYSFPETSAPIYITGQYNNINYYPTITLAGSSKMYLKCLSEIQFSNIHFNATNTAGCVEFFSGPSLRFGENMVFTYNGGAIDDNYNGRIAVRMGFFDRTCSSASFEMTSGTISYIHGGNNKYSVDNSYIAFGGTASVKLYIQGGGTNKNVSNSSVSIFGGTILTLYINGYGSANMINSSISISGGNIQHIDDIRDNTTGGLSGISNITVSGNGLNGINELKIDSTDSISGTKNLSISNTGTVSASIDFSCWDNVYIENNSNVILLSEYQAPSESLQIETGCSLALAADASIPDLPEIMSGDIHLYNPISQEKVFLSGSGNDENSGLSSELPVATLNKAMDKLPDTGGTIVLCGDITINGTYTFAEKNGKVIISGQDNNIYYGSKITLAGTSKMYINCMSEIEFSYLHIDRTNTGGCVEIFSGPSLTFGNGMSFTYNGHAIDSDVSGRIGVRLGYSTANCDYAEFAMQSGAISYVQGGNNKFSVNHSNINIGGNAEIKAYIQGGGTNQNVNYSDISITGGVVPTLYINGYGTANMVDSTIVVSAGTVEKIETFRAEGGIISGDISITTCGEGLSSISLIPTAVLGQADLEFSYADNVILQNGFNGWSSVSLCNNSNVFVRQAFVAPTSLAVNEGCALIIDSSSNSVLPPYVGTGNVSLGIVPYGYKTYEEHLLTSFNKNVAYGQNSVQGTAAYDNYVIAFYNYGSCDIFDMTSTTPGTAIGSFVLESYNEGYDPSGASNSAYTNHANQAMFGPTKFDEADPFPLVYVVIGNSGNCDSEGYIAKLAIERITYENGVWSSQLVQTITYNDNEYPAPFNPQTGMFTYADNPNNNYINAMNYEKIGWGWPAFFVDSAPTADSEGKLYIFSARFRTAASWERTNISRYGIDSYYEDNAYIITEFEMPELPDSVGDFGANITLYPNDITDQFSTEFDCYGTQGGTMYGGRIYYSFGFGGTSYDVKDVIRVFDVGEKKIIAPYGYDLVKSGRINKRKHETYELCVNEAEAAVVRLIFEKYVFEGYGAQRIASYLNEHGYRARSGKMWHHASIRGMICNSTYTGVLRSGKSHSDILPQLQIITTGDFERAQFIRENRAKSAAMEYPVPQNTRGQSLLAGNVYCGHCGARLTLTTNGKAYPCRDDPNRVVKRVRYICYGKTRKQTECDGQTGYTAHILDDIVDKLVRQVFQHMKDIPKDELVNTRYKEILNERKVLLRVARHEYTKAVSELESLRGEVIKSIRGESAFSQELLCSLIKDAEEKSTNAKNTYEAAQKACEESETILNDLSNQYDDIISWADMYDHGSMEAKKMVVNCLIRRIEVYRGYKLHVDFNIAVEQFGITAQEKIPASI